MCFIKLHFVVQERFTPCLIQCIMKACWNQNPRERPTMSQVVEYHLGPTRLLSVGQCQVLRDHVHQYATNKPSNIQYTIPNCECTTSLFSCISAQTPQAERKQNTTSDHSQVWIAQENRDATSKLTIVTFRSSDLGFYVRNSYML